MYENDYSWVPAVLAGFATLGALGGLIISLVRSDQTRRRVLRTWLSVPLLVSVGIASIAAIYAVNLNPWSPILSTLR